MANNHNYIDAIIQLNEIQPSCNAYIEAQGKIAQYQVEQEHYEKIEKANKLVDAANFDVAIDLLESVTENSIFYSQAQSCITNYQLLKLQQEEKRKERRVEAGGRAVEIINLIEIEQIKGKFDVNFEPSITGRIIGVLMELTNTSKKSGNFNFSQFQLIDSNECIYDELSDPSYWY